MNWVKRPWLPVLAILCVGCTAVALGESVTVDPLPSVTPPAAVLRETAVPELLEETEAPPDLPPTNTPAPPPDPRPSPTPRRPQPTPTIPLLPTTGAILPPAGRPAGGGGEYPADDPAYRGRAIDALAVRTYGSGTFTITDTLEDMGSYMRYEFAYDSDGEVVGGFMNVPHEGTKMAVALVLHGYVKQEEYELLAYTTRYADALAEAGYMVFHPSYRHHPLPEEGAAADIYNTFRIDYAVDVLNLVALIRTGALDPTGPLRRADGEYVHLLGHSMGGGIAQRVITVRPGWFRAAVLYGSMSGDERRNYAKIQEWGGERRWEKEVYAPRTVIEAVSPIYFLDRWTAPISIHHGTADALVPPEWSAELCALLQARRHIAECFSYRNYPHTFYGPAEELFIERMIAFFKLH